MATVRVFAQGATALFGSNAVYATAYASSSGIFNTNQADAGQNFTGSVYQVFVGYLAFDTSFLANLGTINSATFKTSLTTDSSVTDFTVNLRSYAYTDNADYRATPSNASWVTPTQASAKTLVAHYDTVNGFAGTVSFVNDALAANINTSGLSKFILTSSRYESATTPTGNEFIVDYLQYCWLEIDYTPSPVSSTVFVEPTENDNGMLFSQDTTSYSNARGGLGSISIGRGIGQTYSQAGQDVLSSKSGTTYTVYENFVRFDTSFLSGATITGASLSFENLNDTPNTNFEIQARSATFSTLLTSTDFIPGANLSSKTLLAHINTLGLATLARNTLTNDNLVANINTSGFTSMVIVSKEIVDNVTPTSVNNIRYFHSNYGFSWKLTVSFTGLVGPVKTLTNMSINPGVTWKRRFKKPQYNLLPAIQSTNPLVNASITQVAANLILTGGTQAVSSVQIASITQVSANLVLTLGTQVVASVQIVNISQTSANLVLTPGTQAISAVQNSNITQTSVNLVLSAGTQAVATTQLANITQTSTNLVLTSGTQAIATVNIANITQTSVNLLLTGGIQFVSGSSGVTTLNNSVLLTDGQRVLRVQGQNNNYIQTIDGEFAVKVSNKLYLKI